MTTIKQFWLPIVLAIYTFALAGLGAKVFLFPTITADEKKIIAEDNMILRNNIIPFLTSNVDNGKLAPIPAK